MRAAPLAFVFGLLAALPAAGEDAVPPEAAALDAALDWLIRHQEADGGWRAAGFSGRCARAVADAPAPCDGAGREEYNLALTGFAVQALAAAPDLPAGSALPGPEQSRTPGATPAVDRALGWLTRQLPSQLDGSGTWHFYNLAIASAGLAAALEKREDAAASAVLLRAVRKILAAQNADGGWSSPAQRGDSDSSGTGWCLDALAAARRARVDVPADAFVRAVRWYTGVTAPDGRVGYRVRGDRGFDFGDEAAFVRHDILTPTRFAALPGAAGGVTPEALNDLRRKLARDLPSPNRETSDFLYWLQGTRALATDRARAGVPDRAWLRALRRAIVQGQQMAAGDCPRGSWEPEDRWSSYGGRVYATALNALTLEAALPALREAEAVRAAPLSEAERNRLRDLAQRLGSGTFREREEATRALEEAGDRAEPFLKEAAASDDTETRTRAKRLLERLGGERK